MRADDEPRALLGATLHPVAAAVIYRDMGADLRRRVVTLRALGQVEVARHLSSALAQLRSAAQQLEALPEQRRDDWGPGDADSTAGTEDWLTTDQVAAQLGGLSVRQVRNLREQLGGVRVGRGWRFAPEAVLEERQRRGLLDGTG